MLLAGRPVIARSAEDVAVGGAGQCSLGQCAPASEMPSRKDGSHSVLRISDPLNC